MWLLPGSDPEGPKVKVKKAVHRNSLWLSVVTDKPCEGLAWGDWSNRVYAVTKIVRSHRGARTITTIVPSKLSGP